VHELAAYGLLGLIALHIAGAFLESAFTKENLMRSIVTGSKQVRPGDAISAPIRARPVLELVILIPTLAGAAAGVWMLSERPGLGVPVAALDPVYVAECGACHTAYHPSLLPRAAWTGIMGGLDAHFGEDASLPVETVASLTTYLTQNAAEAFDTMAANRLRIVDPANPFRITATPFWKRRHAEIPAAVFASKAVGSRGQCTSCHADAARGLFHPSAIAIPQETAP